MKAIFFVLFVILFSNLSAQNTLKLTYLKQNNGQVIPNQDAIVVYTNTQQTLISTENNLVNKGTFPMENTLINRSDFSYISSAQFKDGTAVKTKDSVAIAQQNFQFFDEVRKLKGYTCKKAQIVINSNTIELWYTTDLMIAGSPMILGQKLGLVLEIVRNGSVLLSIQTIENIKTFPIIPVFQSNAPTVDLLTYRDELFQHRFTTIPIFKAVKLAEKQDTTQTDLRYFANESIVLKKVKFPKIAASSQVFIDVKEQSSGDAYDRTGSVFIVPMKKAQTFLDGLEKGVANLPVYTNGNGKEYQGVTATSTFDPLIELVRFFTPFGVGHYNTIQLKGKTWANHVDYRQDITDLSSELSEQEVYLGFTIFGKHTVSVNVTIHEEEGVVVAPKKVVPLFNTMNVMEFAGQNYGTMFSNEEGLKVEFNLEKPIKNAKLRYITTGHGGWENGDEFVPKKNSIFLNNLLVHAFYPWRQDCGAFRNSNPASGNFGNGLSSSDYSRSNWCPGTATNPVYIDLGDLKSGKYSVQVKIPLGPNEGTSFSAWNVSGCIIGEEQN
jgi:GLPGLI family protein